MEQLTDILATFDFRPFAVSLKTAGTAMIFVIVLGTLAAWWTHRTSSKLKGLFDSIFTLPMVLPPTVVGFFLLVTLGRSSGLGSWLLEHGIRLIFTWPATVIAAAVVSFPLMYRTVRASFEQIDPDLLDAGRILGFSELKVFFKLMVPLSWPSIAAGTVLAFARALGEFGATLFVAGNFPGVTQTMPIAVYFSWAAGDLRTAGIWVIIIAISSFLIVFGINQYVERLDASRKRRAR